MKPRVAVLAGDGIGPEVVGVAVEDLHHLCDVVTLDVGADRYLTTGDLLTDADVETIGSCDALLFGAIGDPRVPDGVLERGVLLELRKRLDLYINLRPFPELDLVIVRENTEGMYAGAGATRGSIATEISVNSRNAVERCTRYACELATQRQGRLTLVHKTNVLLHAGKLWKETVASVAEDYGVEVAYEHIDAAAYHLVRDRGRFDVIVTDNLFGDILSDLAAGIGNGLGHAASANLHPERSTRPTQCIGLFEPVHGSAPDIAGKGVADPTAAIAAARMMLSALENERVLT